MDSFEVNKILGGLLGACLFTMALGIFSDALFYRPPPAKPGYDLPAAQEPTAGSAAAAPAAAPLPVLMAQGNAQKGENFAKPCTVCHNFEKGAGVKIGPPLYGVIGRAVASVPGYPYSDALKSIGGDWTFAKVFQFIANPRAMAPGTKMTFPGEPDPDKRADIIDYLDTLSDNPVPMPAVDQGAAPAATSAATPGGSPPTAPATTPPAAPATTPAVPQ
jgi:cytochrome c